MNRVLNALLFAAFLFGMGLMLLGFLYWTVSGLEAAPAPRPAVHGASQSGTVHEYLCVEGYLPDGTYWSCPEGR